MSWSSRKKTRAFILSEGIFFNIFYLNVQCIEYTFGIYTVFHIKSITSYIFLPVFKIFESFQCILTAVQNSQFKNDIFRLYCRRPQRYFVNYRVKKRHEKYGKLLVKEMNAKNYFTLFQKKRLKFDFLVTNELLNKSY